MAVVTSGTGRPGQRTKEPQFQQRLMIELANRLHAQSVIAAGELAELLEQADAVNA